MDAPSWTSHSHFFSFVGREGIVIDTGEAEWGSEWLPTASVLIGGRIEHFPEEMMELINED
jgi:hypothetical protein|tara:strand:+ start:1436 stop:1618 length:183 start_codon:yes stop_codon:yes gene_type:complete